MDSSASKNPGQVSTLAYSTSAINEGLRLFQMTNRKKMETNAPRLWVGVLNILIGVESRVDSEFRHSGSCL